MIQGLPWLCRAAREARALHCAGGLMRPDSRRLNRAGRSCVQQSCSFLRWLACLHRNISEGIHNMFSRDLSSQLFRTYAAWGSMQNLHNHSPAPRLIMGPNRSVQSHLWLV